MRREVFHLPAHQRVEGQLREEVPLDVVHRAHPIAAVARKRQRPEGQEPRVGRLGAALGQEDHVRTLVERGLHVRLQGAGKQRHAGLPDIRHLVALVRQARLQLVAQVQDRQAALRAAGFGGRDGQLLVVGVHVPAAAGEPQAELGGLGPAESRGLEADRADGLGGVRRDLHLELAVALGAVDAPEDRALDRVLAVVRDVNRRLHRLAGPEVVAR
ncbi:hypothetical protein D3C72_969360 [compost metagenome]